MINEVRSVNDIVGTGFIYCVKANDCNQQQRKKKKKKMNWNILFVLTSVFVFHVNIDRSTANAENSNLLFVYGNFMIYDNIHRAAPLAEKFDIGLAKQYRLDYTVYTKDLDFPFDTIIEDKCEEGIWGVVWNMSNDWETFKKNLITSYKFIEFGEITIETANNGQTKCFVIFVQEKFRQKKLVYGQGFPLGRRPTSQYMSSVVQGAEENKLPINYIKKLQTIPTIDKTKQLTFYLFAYGANMLLSRINEIAPSAKVYTIGTLKDTELKSACYLEKWGGCVYTYVPRFNQVVWGVIFEVNITEIDELDEQGGVNEGRYEEIEEKIETPDGKIVNCMTYQLLTLPRSKNEECPPSDNYQKLVIQGAVDNKLPEKYIHYLQSLHPATKSQSII